MSDISILKEMFKESMIVLLQENEAGTHLNRFVILEETQDRYSVTIEGMPNDDQVIVIKADKFESPPHIFNGTKGEGKRADFVIIANTNTEKIILCIELKKKKDREKFIINQLMGAKCFIFYCQEIGKNFWNQYNFLDDYQYHFVSIGRISVPRKSTRPSKSKESNFSYITIHNNPGKILKISSPHNLQYDHLIAK
jgi:hypothetical protein